MLDVSCIIHIILFIAGSMIVRRAAEEICSRLVTRTHTHLTLYSMTFLSPARVGIRYFTNTLPLFFLLYISCHAWYINTLSTSYHTWYTHTYLDVYEGSARNIKPHVTLRA